MDHSICFNSLSLPAENKKFAYELLIDACHGLLELNIEDSDRFLLYYDDTKSNRIYESILSEDNYTYNDFLDELEANGHRDLLSFLLETDDKSPTLDYLLTQDDDFLEDFGQYHFYLPDTASKECMDTLGFSWFLNATLLSLNTEPIWGAKEVKIACLHENTFIQKFLFLNNISKFDHGKIIRSDLIKFKEKKFEETFPDCVFTNNFKDWSKNLNENNLHNVKEKLRIAYQRNFQGGEPLFKTLNKADGLREIRFSAYPGGAIRILFKILPNNKPAILLGFIKKNDTEGYKENIPQANVFFEDLLKKIKLETEQTQS